MAQPTGGQVVSGSATISQGVGALTVTQTSSRAIINWQDFSIAAGTFARFIQPDATSATLNRVVSGLPSSLAGNLEANGRIYLINPNGLLVGAGARIDTAGFLASTLDVTNQEFLAGGDLHFTGGSTAAIKNLGAINALGGDVYLIARQVENSGAVSANGGTAGLAAGSEVLLTTGGAERLFIQAAPGPGAVVNSGTITAASAELKAAGGNAYALAINHSGLIRATGLGSRQGAVWLVAGGGEVDVSGTIDVSSATVPAGRVVVTGERVLLDTGARLDASGTTGGEIFVGGGWQGNDPAIQNASAVVMRPETTIDVSATESGHGGTAVLWSQDYTAFHGRILAKGGRLGGNGGRVETSSHVNLQVFGSVDSSAPSGEGGRWTLDPLDVTIAATGAVGTAYAAIFTPTADSVILASSIASSLEGGSDVTITTGTTGSSAGDIFVNQAVSWTTNRTLTLSAERNIEINADLIATGATAGLVLTPNAGGGMLGGYSLKNGASITLSGLTPSLTIAGASYTVINSLGVAGDATSTTLQGMQNTLAGRFALGSNIDAMDTGTWNAGAGFAPIGTTGAHYTGTFDGLGHTVSGLMIARPAQNDVGLFGYLGDGGVVRNITLAGGSVTGMTGTGALLGSNAGSVSYASASTTVSGLSNVGGLVGSNSGTLSRAWATGTVSNASGTVGFVGGLVGNNVGTISSSWASGNSSGTGPNVGGLVGFHQGAGGSISNSYATGNISGPRFLGGLTGSNNAPVTNSYATGSVTGTGLYVGGLVGYNYTGIAISNTYATGSVSGAGSAGGLAGNNAGTISTSYWNNTINATGIGGGTTTGATGKTTAEMMQMATFTGFNIASTGDAGATWRIYEGNTTPWLTVFLTPLTATPNNDSRAYNGALYTGGNGVSYSITSPNPAPSGALTYGGTAQSALNAGSYTLSAAGLYSVQQGYDISYATGTLTINQANLTLGGTRAYDGSTVFAGSNLTAAGVNGETFTVTGAGASGNLGTKNVQTGQVLASVSGLTLGSGNTGAALSTNYNALATAGSAVSVTAANLTISTTNVVKTYDGGTTALGTPVVTAGTLLGSDVLAVGGLGASYAFVGKDVGLGIKTVTIAGVGVNDGNSGNNYTVVLADNTTSTINPATLTYTANAANRLYGATNPAFAGTVTGFVNSETLIGATTGTTFFGSPATVTSNVGTFAINGSGLSANNGNYLFVQAAGNATALTINAANLVLTGTRVYDGSTMFAGSNLTATGVNGETFTLGGAGASGNLATRNVQAGQLLASVSGLTLGSGNAGTTLSSNYNALSTAGSSVSVTAANLTLGGTRTYDGSTVFSGSNLTATGVNGETFTLGGAGASGNLGTRNVQTGQLLASVSGLTLGSGNTGTTLSSNYNALSAAGSSVSVTAASLTISTTNVVKTYDGGTTALGTPVVTAGTLFGGDVLAVGGLGASYAFVGKDVGLGNKTVTIAGVGVNDGNSGNNYTVVLADNTTSTINPATLTYTANAATRLVSASDPVFSGTVTGFASGEAQGTATTGTMGFATPATGASPVGTYALNGNGLVANAGNYLFVQAAANATAFTITSLLQVPLTITADSLAKHYGATLPAFTASYAGFINGDTASSVTGLQFSTTATMGSNAGTYTITPFGATAPAAYLVGYLPGLLTINPALLTYTATPANRLFGAGDPAFSGTITGFVNGDASGTATTGTMSFTTPATVLSVPGSYALNGSGLNANNGNYLFVQATSNATAFTIGALPPAATPLTITANNLTSIYGAALPAFTASYAGFINGDTAASVTGLQFSTTATMGSNIGLFTITPFGATAPAAYLVGYLPGTLTISPAALTLTANSATRLYGAANAAFSGTYTGFVNGDTSSVVTGQQFSTPATAASNIGDYVITSSGAVAANYALSFAPGLLTVERRALTLTALDAERIFGTINPVFSASFNGFVNGDSAASVSGLVFNTTATPASLVGTYPIAPAGAMAANYTLVFVNGQLRITAPSVTVGTTEQTVVLIGQQPALTPELAVILQGDRVVLVPVNASGDDSGPLADRLAITLGAITRLPALPPGSTLAGSFTPGRPAPAAAVNFGRFELVASFNRREGGGSLGRAGNLSQAQMNEPGLFRESSVNMGGFNIIYHEALADVRRQDEDNTALGSSYREFSDTDNPQVNLVRAKIDRKPATPATGVNAGGSL